MKEKLTYLDLKDMVQKWREGHFISPQPSINEFVREIEKLRMHALSVGEISFEDTLKLRELIVKCNKKCNYFSEDAWILRKLPETFALNINTDIDFSNSHTLILNFHSLRLIKRNNVVSNIADTPLVTPADLADIISYYDKKCSEGNQVTIYEPFIFLVKQIKNETPREGLVNPSHLLCIQRAISELAEEQKNYKFLKPILNILIRKRFLAGTEAVSKNFTIYIDDYIASLVPLLGGADFAHNIVKVRRLSVTNPSWLPILAKQVQSFENIKFSNCLITSWRQIKLIHSRKGKITGAKLKGFTLNQKQVQHLKTIYGPNLKANGIDLDEITIYKSKKVVSRPKDEKKSEFDTMIERERSVSILMKTILKGRDSAKEIAEKLEESYKLGTLPELLNKPPSESWNDSLLHSHSLIYIKQLKVLKAIYSLIDERNRRHLEKQVFEAILDHSMESNWQLLVKALYMFQTQSQKETQTNETVEQESTEKETGIQVQPLSSAQHVIIDDIQKEEGYLAILKELATESIISKRDNVDITLSFYIAFISKDINSLLDLAFSKYDTFTQIFSETVMTLSKFTDGLLERRLFFEKFLIRAQAEGFYSYDQCFDVVNNALECEKLDPIHRIEFTPMSNQESPREPDEYEYHSLDKDRDNTQPAMEAPENEKESVFFQATGKVQGGVSSFFSAAGSVFYTAASSVIPKKMIDKEKELEVYKPSSSVVPKKITDKDKEPEVSKPSSSSVFTSLSFSAIFGSKGNMKKELNEPNASSELNSYQS